MSKKLKNELVKAYVWSIGEHLDYSDGHGCEIWDCLEDDGLKGEYLQEAVHEVVEKLEKEGYRCDFHKNNYQLWTERVK